MRTLMTTAVLLSVSGQLYAAPLSSEDRQIVDELYGSSGTVLNQINLGNSFVTGAVVNATTGNVIQGDAHTQAIITDAHQDSYNTAMSNFMSNTFYGAQEHLNDMVNIAEDNLEVAVDNYTSAVSDIAVVEAIAQQASTVNSTQEAEVLQDVAISNGADQGITDVQQDNYNTSLQEVNTAAREFAGYKSAAVAPHLVEHMDQFADQYGQDHGYAVTAIDPINMYITTTYASGMNLVHGDYYVQNQYVSNESVYQDGQTIYAEQSN